ncbi:hypothetical protein ES702_06688 [subsurface metagenome]
MIDEIVEMILKEARARKGLSLTTRVYNVISEVDRRVGEIMRDFSHEERRMKIQEKDDSWNKGM